jgi:hypothetical protein
LSQWMLKVIQHSWLHSKYRQSLDELSPWIWMAAGKSFDMKHQKFGDYQDKIWNMLALVSKFLGKYSEIWRLTSSSSRLSMLLS